MAQVERVEYTMTAEFLDRAVKAFIPPFVAPMWSRQVWITFFVLLGCSAVCAYTTFLALDEDLGDDVFLLSLGALVVCAVLPVLMLASLVFGWCVSLFVPACRWVLRARMFRACRPIMDTTIRWAFSESGFTTESIETVRTVSWSDLKWVRRSPDVWIFSLKEGPELMFPDSSLTDGIRSLVERKAAERAFELQSGN